MFPLESRISESNADTEPTLNWINYSERGGSLKPGSKRLQQFKWFMWF